MYHDDDDEIVAIEDISLNINKGEFISIVGPSGCGKSTLLSVLSNIEEKSNGEILLNKNLKIGYMLQKDSLFPWRTILENCLTGLEITNSLNDTTKKKSNKIIRNIWTKGIYE